MADKADDLQAVRTIVSALEPFEPDEQRRILRWSTEKIGLAVPTAPIATERNNIAQTPSIERGGNAVMSPPFSSTRDIRFGLHPENSAEMR
jgi:hypothetical protein